MEKSVKIFDLGVVYLQAYPSAELSLRTLWVLDELGLRIHGSLVAGTLTFTPDGEEADAIRGEERVAIDAVLDAWSALPSHRRIVQLSEALSHLMAVSRPLPDAPKPVAAWERPVMGVGGNPYICSVCGIDLSRDRLGDHCWGCSSPLASTASPWPRGASDD
jgi:hypothetical protein